MLKLDDRRELLVMRMWLPVATVESRNVQVPDMGKVLVHQRGKVPGASMIISPRHEFITSTESLFYLSMILSIVIPYLYIIQ